MKITLRILGGILVLVIVLIGVAVVTINAVDVSSYQGLVTDRVAAATGRQLTIEGPIEVELALSPSISATGIRLANAEWGSEPSMLTVETFETRLALIPLIFGEHQIDYVLLDGVEVLVESGPDGQSNWQFGDGAAARPAGELPAAADLPRITDIVFQNVRVRQRQGDPSADLVTTIRHSKAHLEDLRSPIQMSVDAAWRDTAFKANGELGAPVILTQPGAPYPIDLTIDGEGLRATVKGTIGAPLQVSDLSLTAEAAIDNAQTLTALLGPGVPALTPVKLAASISGAASDLKIGAIRAELADTKVSGQMSYAATGERPRITANLQSERIDMAALMAAMPAPPPAPESADSGAEEKPAAAPVSPLKAYDVEASVAVGELVLPAQTIRDLSAKVVLVNGVAQINPLSFSLGEGDARGDVGGKASVDLASARPTFDVELSASKLDLAPLAGPADDAGGSENVFPDTPFDLSMLKGMDGRLRFTGQDLRWTGLSVPELDLDANLADGALAVAPFSAVVAGSRLSAEMGVDANGAVPRMDLLMVSEALDVGRLLSELEVSRAVRGTAKANLSLSGAGGSMAALMGGLNGHARLLMSDGRIKTQALDLAVGGLQTVLGTMFTGGSEWAVVNCAAADFGVESGLATARALVADTEFSTVAGTGDVDLGDEQIDLLFTPESKGVTLNVAVPVKVTGPLAAPRVGLDEAAVVADVGASVLGALVFPPAVLAGFVDLGGDQTNPCLNPEARVMTPAADRVMVPVEEVLDQAGEAVGEAIDDAGEVLEDAGEAVGDMIDDVGEGISDLLNN